MDYAKLNLSKIQFEVNTEPNHIGVKYDDKFFVINTPVIYIPFGIDEVYDKFYTKLQFENHETDADMQLFMDTLIAIEEHIKKYIIEKFGSQFELSSEFNYKEERDPTINTKLVSYRGKPKTRIISRTNTKLNYWQIEPNSLVKCKMSLSGIWPRGEKFYYKWNLEEIKLMT